MKKNLLKILNSYKGAPLFLLVFVLSMGIVFILTDIGSPQFNNLFNGNYSERSGFMDHQKTGPPILISDIDSGKSIYTQYCISCHLENGTANGGKTGADFTNKEGMARSDEELLNSIRNGVTGKIGVMPGWKGVLTERQMENVLYYIRATFQKTSYYKFENPPEALEEFEGNKARPFMVKEKENGEIPADLEDEYEH